MIGTVYAIRSLDNQDIFYVGATRYPLRFRIEAHLLNKTTRAGQKIQQLNSRIEPIVLEEVLLPKERFGYLMLPPQERAWITFMSHKGYPLVNVYRSMDISEISYDQVKIMETRLNELERERSTS